MSRELIDLARAGDAAAFDRLLLAHYDSLSRYIKRELSTKWQGKFEIDDVLQETFASAFRSFDQFRGETTEELDGWLKTTAQHRLLDLVRAQTRKKRGGAMKQVGMANNQDGTDDQLYNLVQTLATEIDTPSQMVAKSEAVAAIREAIARLPSEQRTVVQLRCLDMLELDEVARLTAKTVPAVRGLIHRAKQALKDDLGQSTQWFGSG